MFFIIILFKCLAKQKINVIVQSNEIFVIFLSYFCYIFVVFLLYFCCIFVISLLYFCYIFVIFLLYFCCIFVIFLLYFCYIFVIFSKHKEIPLSDFIFKIRMWLLFVYLLGIELLYQGNIGKWHARWEISPSSDNWLNRNRCYHDRQHL